MGPAEYRGEGEEHDGDRDECAAYETELVRKYCGNQRRLGLRGIDKSSCIQINETGGQNGKRCERAYDDCIGEHLEDAPHALTDRLPGIGV